MFFERDRPLVEEGLWVRRGVLPVGNRDASKVFARDPVLMHITGREHRDPGGGGEHAEGQTPTELDHDRRGATGATRDPRAEAGFGTFVESAIDQSVVARATVYGHRGLMDGAASGAPAVMDAAEVAEFLDAQVACDIDLVVDVDRERDHSVDLVRTETRIANGRVARLDGQAKGAAPRVLGKLCGADPDDSGFPRE
ncbi:MAG: hypothetical protein H8E37_10270 [Planctomycetes bacterium]|nr:hypothetical protein [Planctomycetota bacterium]